VHTCRDWKALAVRKALNHIIANQDQYYFNGYNTQHPNRDVPAFEHKALHYSMRHRDYDGEYHTLHSCYITPAMKVRPSNTQHSWAAETAEHNLPPSAITLFKHSCCARQLPFHAKHDSTAQHSCSPATPE
jgi:hypothetical protein